MRGGWFRDSYRHSLAARGIQTIHRRYMADKVNYALTPEVVIPGRGRKPSSGSKGADETAEFLAEQALGEGQPKPSTLTGRSSSTRGLKRELRRAVIERKPVFGVLDGIRDGDTGGALDALDDKSGYSDREKAAVRAELAKYAVKSADLGIDVEPDVLVSLDPVAKARVESLQKLRAREVESPLKTVLREQEMAAARATARGVAKVPGRLGAGALTAAGSVVEIGAAGMGALSPDGLTAEKQFKGPLSQEDDLIASPPFDKDVNFFIGNGPGPLSMAFDQPSFLGAQVVKQKGFHEVGLL